MIYGVRGGTELVRFSPDSPGSVTSLGGFGPGASDPIVGLDRRPPPSDNQLYALSRSGRVFVVSIVGAANPSVITTEIQSLNVAGSPTGLPTGRVATDFNPAANALRLIGEDGLNLRVPTAALVAPAPVPAVNTLVDGRMGYRKGVTAAAYSNPAPNSSPPTTQLFVIDPVSNVLYRQNANAGELGSPVNLNLNVNGVNGYDIYQEDAAADNEHFVLMSEEEGSALLYGLNPDTGVMTLLSTRNDISDARGLVVVRNAVAPTGQFAPPLRAFVLDSEGDSEVVRSFAFNRQTVDIGTPMTTLSIDGLVTDERLIGIDSRTTSRVAGRIDILYGVTTENRVVALLPSGNTLVVSDSAPLTTDPANNPNGDPVPLALDGSSFGVDFNPDADLLRIVSNTGQNLRVNLEQGRELNGRARAPGFAIQDRTTRVTADPDRGLLTPRIVATAYRGSNIPGRFQYAIDAANNSLALVVSPNDGALEPVNVNGSLGVVLVDGAEQSLDIARHPTPPDATDLAYASLRTTAAAQRSALYMINLDTGVATLVGSIGVAGSDPVDSITVRFE